MRLTLKETAGLTPLQIAAMRVQLLNDEMKWVAPPDMLLGAGAGHRTVRFGGQLPQIKIAVALEVPRTPRGSRNPYKFRRTGALSGTGENERDFEGWAGT